MLQYCWNNGRLVSELKSTLRNSSHLSASHSEDVKILRVALFTKRGRCWEYSWDYNLFILFVFHEELCKELRTPLVDVTFVIRDFKIYDAAARRRGLQNKRIICARQSEWIILVPMVFSTPSSFCKQRHSERRENTSSERRELAERWKLFHNVNFGSKQYNRFSRTGAS